MLTEKHKVAIDARMINHSGIGTYIKSVITALGEHYDLIALGPAEILKTQAQGNVVRIINLKSSIYTIAEQLELYLKIPECDLFLSPHYNIPLFLKRANKRAVIIHDVNHLAFIDQLSITKKFYAKFMINAAVRKSDKIITISEFSKSEILKYTQADEAKIAIVNYGIDKQKYQKQSSQDHISSLRKKYNLPEKYLLYVGSTKPHKNFSGLVKAFNLVLESYPGKKLVVVGIKPDELVNIQDIYNIPENHGVGNNLIFTSYVEENDLTEIYKNALCLVFPSIYEGFGIPTLEAMASGCPVIASNMASIPEVCDNAAIYFDPKNIKDIADRIKTILSDENLRSDLIERGKKNLERFTTERFSDELISVINNTINA